MVRYTLRQLTYFRAVADQGGIAQAARILNISQPSISQALAKLEDVTGLTLFERHHARGLELTLQGRSFLKHAVDLEENAKRLESEARALAMESIGEIRFGAFWTLSPFFAAGMIKHFKVTEPGVSFIQSELALAEIANRLNRGGIDVALTYDRGADLTGLTTVVLAEVKPKIILAADHPLATQGPITLKDLSDEPYVMLDGPGSWTYFEELWAECGVKPRIAYTSGSLESVRSAVAAGFGYTLLVARPPSAMTYDGGRVVAIDLADAVRPLKIVMACRPSTDHGLLRRFIDSARDYITGLQGQDHFVAE